jgi:hypothetical protein
MRRIANAITADFKLENDELNQPKSIRLAMFFNRLKIIASIATILVIVPSLFYDSERFELLSNILLGIFYIFALATIYFNYEDSKMHLKNMVLKNMLPVGFIIVVSSYFIK